MKSQIWDQYKSLSSLINTLDDKQKNSLLSRRDVSLKTYAPSHILHVPEEICERVELILSGKITIEHSDEQGRFLVITDLGPGDLIGGQVIFSAEPRYPMTITVSLKTVLLEIGRETLLALMREHEPFLLEFLSLISDNAARLGDKIRMTIRRPIRDCVLEYLEAEVKRQGRRTIVMNETKRAFAERIGVQRTSLQRELKKMKQDGLIDYDRYTLTLLDKKTRQY